MKGAGTKSVEAAADPVLQELVQGLVRALGARLQSVVLFGSAARGDYHPDASDYNVILVLDRLDAATLETIAPVVRPFVAGRHPVPRLFTPELIAASADSFPIEFVDIRAGRTVLHGADPFAGIEVARAPLRLQLERELKEKMMRLREGYVMSHDDPLALRSLLIESYSAFAALFRGGLHLIGRPVPAHGQEVVAAFCDALGLQRAPFEEVAHLRRGGRAADLKALFARYHDELSRAADGVDRLSVP